MKKTLFLISCIACFCLGKSYAQTQIPNGGFENWIDSVRPVNWSCLFVPAGPYSLYTGSRSADSHSGNYALKVESKTNSVVGQVLPGVATLGTINMNQQIIEGGIPFNAKPSKIKGYYKYFPANTDTMGIFVNFLKRIDSLGMTVIIGVGEFMQSATVNSYTQFESNIIWSPTFGNYTPDSMNIIIVSSAGDVPKLGSRILIDDLTFDYSPIGISKINNDFKIDIYPNPAKENLYINFNSLKNTITEVSVMNLLGENVSKLKTNSNSIKISDLKEGIYFVKVANGNNIKTQKIIVK